MNLGTWNFKSKSDLKFIWDDEWHIVLQGKRIGKKKKTSVKSCNLNPYWNESFVFLIDEMDMKRVVLDVTVILGLNLKIIFAHFTVI